MFFYVFVPFFAVFQHLIFTHFAPTSHQLCTTSKNQILEQKLKVILHLRHLRHFSIFFILKWRKWSIVPCTPCIFTDFLLLYIFCTKMA